MSDGGLKLIFTSHILDWDWQSIETGGTGRGIPDLNYCVNYGIEGWIENKATSTWTVKITPEQIAWIERRDRYGGKVCMAVRRQTIAGPRKGPRRDQLYLIPPKMVRLVYDHGLNALTPSCFLMFEGGPEKWDWPKIRNYLSTPNAQIQDSPESQDQAMAR
jgi:hypothetical protein